jgi:hypothetical protein
VRRLRRGLRALGIAPGGGAFCVQTLPPLPRPAAARLDRHLLAAGVRVIVQPSGSGAAGRAVLILTARTSDADVDAALDAIACAPALALLRRGGPAAAAPQRGRDLVRARWSAAA